jgi:adenylate cyclase
VDKEITISQVTGIGEPYGIYLDRDDMPKLTEIEPYPVSYTVLEGKHAENEERTGQLTAVSDREAILKTQEKLSIYDNLLLKVEEGLYAKVTETGEKGCRICFTSRTGGFQTWLETIRQNSPAGA